MVHYIYEEETLSAYIDGELSTDEAEKIEEHLRGCHYCREVLNRMQLVSRMVRELPRPVVNPAFTMQLMSQLRSVGTGGETPSIRLLELWGVLSLLAIGWVITMPIGYAGLRCLYTISVKLIKIFTELGHFVQRIPPVAFNMALGVAFLVGAIIAFYGFTRVYADEEELLS